MTNVLAPLYLAIERIYSFGDLRHLYTLPQKNCAFEVPSGSLVILLARWVTATAPLIPTKGRTVISKTI